MGQARTRQLLLPFVDASVPWEKLPKRNQDQCRALLAQLLAKVIEAEAKESKERRTDERREDSSNAS